MGSPTSENTKDPCFQPRRHCWINIFMSRRRYQKSRKKEIVEQEILPSLSYAVFSTVQYNVNVSTYLYHLVSALSILQMVNGCHVPPKLYMNIESKGNTVVGLTSYFRCDQTMMTMMIAWVYVAANPTNSANFLLVPCYVFFSVSFLLSDTLPCALRKCSPTSEHGPILASTITIVSFPFIVSLTISPLQRNVVRIIKRSLDPHASVLYLKSWFTHTMSCKEMYIKNRV